MKTTKQLLSLFFAIILVTICCILLCGCGHNIVHTDRGLGVKLRIPLPDGGSIIDFAIGQIDSTTAVVRGNTTYSSSDTGGATITGTANLTQHIQMSSGPQLNEGNIVKIMINENCPKEAKIAAATMLVKQKAPEPQPTVSKTPNAAIASGDAPPDVELAKSTVETIVEGTPKVLEAAAKPIEASAAPIEAVSKPASDAIKTSVEETTDMIEDVASKIVIAVIIASIILILVGLYFIYKKNKLKKTHLSQ